MTPVDRRSFLARSGALLGATGAAIVVESASAANPAPSRPSVALAPGSAASASNLATTQPFNGVHQAGTKRPTELTQMPTFPVDQLDPDLSHGDVLLQICAQHRDTVVHTVRELLRTVRWLAATAMADRRILRPRPRPITEEQYAQPVRLPRRHRQPLHDRLRADERPRMGEHR